MSRWIKSFENATAIQNAVDNGDLLKPYVAYDESAATIDWNSKSIDYTAMPLTFEILSDGNIYWTSTYTGETTLRNTIEYSKNGGEWVTISSSYQNTWFSVKTGDKIKFRGNNPNYTENSNGVTSKFNLSCSFSIKGNIMSLINKDNYQQLTTLSGTTPYNGNGYAFYKLFSDCTGLTDASNLVLPATTLANYCYDSMFQGCTSLTTAPELPATTLASNCYSNMFRGCTSLTVAPSVLPATTLAINCYSYMFGLCSNLNYIKCLATDISAKNCTNSWVWNVSSTGTFVKASGMNDWTTGWNGIPSNWTVQDA